MSAAALEVEARDAIAEPLPRGLAACGLPRVRGDAGVLAAQMDYNRAEFKDWMNE